MRRRQLGVLGSLAAAAGLALVVATSAGCTGVGTVTASSSTVAAASVSDAPTAISEVENPQRPGGRNPDPPVKKDLREALQDWTRANGPAISLLSLLLPAPRLLITLIRWLIQGFPSLPVRRSQGSQSRKRFRNTPLLTLATGWTADLISHTGRIPLEPRKHREGRLGWWRRYRALTRRPSAPKPAFLIDSWHLRKGAQYGYHRSGSRFGGFALEVILHRTEDRMHLDNSLRPPTLALWRTPRTVILATVGEFLRGQPVRAFRVNASLTHYARDRSDALIFYSADPLYSGKPREDTLMRDKIPPDAIWLLSQHGKRLEPLTTERDTAVPGKHSRSRRFLHWCKDVMASCRKPARVRRKENDFPRRYRMFRWLIPVGLVTLSALLLAIAVVAWSGSRIDPNDPPIGFELLTLGISALWIAALGFVLVHASAYAIAEFKQRRSWTATTSRCLADGNSLRNGYFETLTLSERRALEGTHET